MGVGWQLVALVLLPTMSLALLSVPLIAGRFETAMSARAVAREVHALKDLMAVRSALRSEQVAAETILRARAFGVPEVMITRMLGFDPRRQVASTRAATDEALTSVDTARTPADGGSLDQLRRSIDDGSVKAEEVTTRYDAVSQQITDQIDISLVALHRRVGDMNGNEEVYEALAVMRESNAMLTAASGEVTNLAGLMTGRNSENDSLEGDQLRMSLAANRALFRHEITRLDEIASPEIRALLDDVVAGSDGNRFSAAVDSALDDAPHDATRISVNELGLVFGAALRLQNTLFDVTQVANRQLLERTTEARQEAIHQLWRWAAEVSFLMAATLAFTWGSARRIGRPLRRLAEQALVVSEGNLDVPACAVGGPHELQLVGAALDDLVANLRILDGQAHALAECSFDDPVLLQPLPGRIGRSLQASVALLSESVSEREQLQERLLHEATHDPLTSLPNRTAAIEEIRRAAARSRRDGTSAAVLFVDLDNFKQANDTHGHRFGDALLCVVAARLKAAAAATDFVARLGGDEFVLISCPVADEGEARALAGRIIEVVSAPMVIDDVSVTVGASVGVAMTPATRGPQKPGQGPHADTTDGPIDPVELLTQADLALYRAKRAGRGMAATFDVSLRQELVEIDEVERALSLAIQRDELMLEYQPIVQPTGELVALEGLVRWRQADGSLLPPGEFVPIAERSHLVVQLGRWVLNAAAAQLAAWTDDRDLSAVTVAVNISGHHLLDPGFVDDVRGALTAWAVDPRRLSVEITETVLIRDLATARRQLERLKQLGVGVAIDDFGTGYTSLGHLLQLPLDTIKIDQSFVNGLDRPRDRAVVRFLTRLARELGVRVVAEGVETERHARQLSQLGCNGLQGFLICRPVTPSRLAAWVNEPSPRSMLRGFPHLPGLPRLGATRLELAPAAETATQPGPELVVPLHEARPPDAA